jgi:hypothetical protein
MAARKTAKGARTSKKASRSVPLFVLGERDREILATVQRAGLFAALDEAQIAEIAGAYQADGMSPALFDIAERHAFSRASQDLALRAPSSAPGVAPFDGVLIDDMSGSRRAYLRLPGQKTRVFAVTTYQDWADLLDLTLAALGDPRRLVALHNEQDDVGEQAYLVATAEQAAVLAEVGWTASWTLPGDPREIDGDEHARTLLPEVRRRLERAGVVGAAEARGGEIRLALDEEARARLVLAFHHMDRHDAALGHRLQSLETEDDPETGILLSPPIRARLAGLTALGVLEPQSRAEDDRLAQRLATDSDLVFAIGLSFRISVTPPREA